MYFASRRLATALASRAFAELPASGAPAVNALIELLQITILLVVAVPLLAIVQPFMAPVEGIGIIVITILLMVVVVTRSARQMQGQIRNATRLIAIALSGAADATAPRGGIIRGPRHRHDYAGQPAPRQRGVGRRLAELDLHTSTGAVVVAIGRGDSEVVVPTGDEILRARRRAGAVPAPTRMPSRSCSARLIRHARVEAARPAVTGSMQSAREIGCIIALAVITFSRLQHSFRRG